MTGASRGIGFALVQQLARRDDAVIFAGARNPSTADQLNSLAKSVPEGKVTVVKLDSESDEDAEAAAKVVQGKVDKVDVLIANAGEFFVFQGQGGSQANTLTRSLSARRRPRGRTG